MHGGKLWPSRFKCKGLGALPVFGGYKLLADLLHHLRVCVTHWDVLFDTPSWVMEVPWIESTSCSLS